MPKSESKPKSDAVSQRVVTALAEPQVTEIRHEIHKDQEHLVVPLVMLVEGVVFPSTAEAPELALADEFARLPAEWDGRPVVLDHPERDGQKVSATSPDILEEEQFGFLANTTRDGPKLLSEMWIDLSRAEALGEDNPDITAAVDKFEKASQGEDVELSEVSTGLFMTLENVSGKFNGEEYSGIWRDVRSNHLAVLPEGTVGACSVEMGCGAPRLNSSGKRCNHVISWRGNQEVLRCNQEGCPCDGRCRDAVGEDADITANQMLMTSTVDGHAHTYDPGESGFTSTVNGHSHEYTVGTPMTNSADGHQHELLTLSASTSTSTDLDPNTEPDPEPINIPSTLFNALKDGELSDRDRRAALEAALDESGASFPEIVAIYSGDFVYAEGFSSTLKRRKYKIANDGKVSLGEETTRVRPVVDFVPVSTKEVAGMTKKEKIEALITNASSRFGEGDRAFLEAQEDDVLEKLTPIEAPPSEDVSAEVEEEEEEAPPQTAEEFIEGAPEEVKQILQEGLQAHRSEKDALIKALTANEACSFSESELQGKGLKELRSLTRLAGGQVFQGRALGVGVVNASKPREPETAPPLPKTWDFDKKPKSAAA